MNDIDLAKLQLQVAYARMMEACDVVDGLREHGVPEEGFREELAAAEAAVARYDEAYAEVRLLESGGACWSVSRI
jgi:hypothetical protein